MRQSIYRPILLWFTLSAIAGVALTSLVFISISSRVLLLARLPEALFSRHFTYALSALALHLIWSATFGNPG